MKLHLIYYLRFRAGIKMSDENKLFIESFLFPHAHGENIFPSPRAIKQGLPYLH